MNKETFEKLVSMNVNDKVEKKTVGTISLTYLSWAYAVDLFTRMYPDFDYEIVEYVNNDGVKVPYMYDENTGYMVTTTITVDGTTKKMWLPVMNSSNKAMKNQTYTYKTKQGEYTVEAATMFDINKTIMRCLVKNMAMFGLGLYIYAGEDLPIVSEEENEQLVNILKEQIEKCSSKDELRIIYKEHKKEFIKDKSLLDFITQKSKNMKEVA